MSKQIPIYKVKFYEPPFDDGETEFLFTSLSAIYEMFNVEQIGCAVANLWNTGVRSGNQYCGRLCTITRCDAFRKPKNAPKLNGNH